jgi:hypothetical protein
LKGGSYNEKEITEEDLEDENFHFDDYDNDVYSNDIYKFNIKNKIWSIENVENKRKAREAHCSTLVNSFFYTYGGRTTVF